MGCAPTTRKRTTVPAGQMMAMPNRNREDKLNMEPSGGGEKNITSIENFKEDNKENRDSKDKRIITSSRLTTRKVKGNELPFEDIVVKEERRINPI